ILSRRFQKQSERLPKHIQMAVFYWITSVRRLGIAIVRKAPGYHDEPLKGSRFGQRSIRLNRAYRIIYRHSQQDNEDLIELLEVTKHEY
ncbi:MAG: hypothetical protein KDD68_18590, partial [Bdellovibrionales bacterium]|nr:hypothetical protein [Bdellovibrionales bacterium]